MAPRNSRCNGRSKLTLDLSCRINTPLGELYPAFQSREAGIEFALPRGCNTPFRKATTHCRVGISPGSQIMRGNRTAAPWESLVIRQNSYCCRLLSKKHARFEPPINAWPFGESLCGAVFKTLTKDASQATIGLPKRLLRAIQFLCCSLPRCCSTTVHATTPSDSCCSLVAEMEVKWHKGGQKGVVACWNG